MQQQRTRHDRRADRSDPWGTWGPLSDERLRLPAENALSAAGRVLRDLVHRLLRDARTALRERPAARLGAFVVASGLLAGVLVWFALATFVAFVRAAFA